MRKCANFLQDFAYRKVAYNSTDYYTERIMDLQKQKPKNWEDQTNLYTQMIERQKAIREAQRGEITFKDDGNDAAMQIDVELFEEMKEKIKTDMEKVKNM